MKILLIFLIIFFGFIFEANAQLCGKYTTTLIIQDVSGKSIKNTKISVVSDKTSNSNYIFDNTFQREAEDQTRFSVSFNEGYIVKGKYKVVVSADGFSTAEKLIEFPHCARQVYGIVLKPKVNSSEFQEMVIIRGELYDKRGRVGFAELTATNSSGRVFRTNTDKNGYYILELPLGDYTLIYQKTGYKPLKITNVAINEKKNIYIYGDAKLEPLGSAENNDPITKNFKDIYKSIDVY